MLDPKSPQHLPEQTQSFFIIPLNFSKTLMKLRKRFLKKLTYKWAVRNVGLFFGRNVLNTLVAECNLVTLVSCMRAVGLRATTSRHLDENFVMREEFHWRFFIVWGGFFWLIFCNCPSFIRFALYLWLTGLNCISWEPFWTSYDQDPAQRDITPDDLWFNSLWWVLN